MSHPNADEVAAAWRAAAPTAIHPELDADGRPTFEGSAFATLKRLLDSLERHPLEVPLADAIVLDYAAGAGRLAVHFARHFGRVVLADVNPRFLSIAVQRLEEAGASNFATLEVDPQPDPVDVAIALEELDANPPDLIVCDLLFLHLPPSAGGHLLRVFGALLPPGGLLSLGVPLYDAPKRPTNWTSVGVWHPTTLEAAAAAAGFEVLEANINPGVFDYRRLGERHAHAHLLRRRP